eukprot:4621016-Prymnesium_polylepis.2
MTIEYTPYGCEMIVKACASSESLGAVSDAEKARRSLALGNACATGSPSPSHDVNGMRNSESTTAAANGRSTVAQAGRMPSAAGAETAPHTPR